MLRRATRDRRHSGASFVPVISIAMDDDSAFEDAVIRFYENNPRVLDKLRSVLRGKVPGVSLRMLDCLVTNYSKAKNVVVARPDGTSVHVYQQYKAHLRGYSKKKFDPFARRGRVVVRFSTGAIETTIAQLSFFRWAIANGIVDYASDHSADLEAYYTNSRGGKAPPAAAAAAAVASGPGAGKPDPGDAEKTIAVRGSATARVLEF